MIASPVPVPYPNATLRGLGLTSNQSAALTIIGGLGIAAFAMSHAVKRQRHRSLGMAVTHRTARTTKGWKARAPHTRSARRALLSRCGPSAFLDPKKLAFPIMAKSGACAIDCEGLRTAYARARQYHHEDIAKKAKKMGGRVACHWA